jgi:5-hydroxyisourate hydrolase-like protein (transthyretin family)
MINVYPNPSTGVFNLEVENATDVTIAVADILGNQLDITVSDNLNGKFVVDMSTVADGVYFVQVKNGDYFATKRITVSK